MLLLRAYAHEHPATSYRRGVDHQGRGRDLGRRRRYTRTSARGHATDIQGKTGAGLPLEGGSVPGSLRVSQHPLAPMSPHPRCLRHPRCHSPRRRPLLPHTTPPAPRENYQSHHVRTPRDPVPLPSTLASFTSRTEPAESRRRRREERSTSSPKHTCCK